MAPPMHPPPSPPWPSQRRRGLRSASRKVSHSPQRLMDIVLGVVSRLGSHNTGVTMLDIEQSTVNDGYLPDRMGTRDLLRYGVMRAVREGRLQRTSGGLYRISSRSRERTEGPRVPSRCPKKSGRKSWFRRVSLTPAAQRSGFHYRRHANRKSPMECSPQPSLAFFSRSLRETVPQSLEYMDEIPSFALKEAVLGTMGSNDIDMDDPTGGDGSDMGGRDIRDGVGLPRNFWDRDSFGSLLSDELSDDERTEDPFDTRPQRRRDDGLSNLSKMERRRDGDHGRAAAAALFILASDIVKVIAQKASNKLNNLSLEPRVSGGAGGGGTVIGGCEGGGGPGSGGGGLGDGRSGEGGSYGGPDFDFCLNEGGPDGVGSEDVPMDATSGTPEGDVEEAGRVVLQGATALSDISTHLRDGAARVLSVSSANGGSYTQSGEKKEAIFKAFQIAAMDIVRVARVFVNPALDKNNEDEDGQSPFLSQSHRDEGFTFGDTPGGEVGEGCQDEDTNSASPLAIDMRSQNSPREMNTNMEVFIRNLLHDVRLLARRVGSCITH